MLRNKPLFIDQIIEQRSSYPNVLSNNCRISSNIKKILLNGKQRRMSKHTIGLISNIEKKIKNGINLTVIKKQDLKKVDDLWGNVTKPIEINEFIDYVVPAPIKKPIVPKLKTASVKAIVPIHAGGSYNPLFDEHQEMLQLALDEEIKKEDEKQKVELKLKFPPELNELVNYK